MLAPIPPTQPMGRAPSARLQEAREKAAGAQRSRGWRRGGAQLQGELVQQAKHDLRRIPGEDGIENFSELR